MSTNAIERRLQRLEEDAARIPAAEAARRNAEQARVVKELFDALEAQFPPEPWVDADRSGSQIVRQTFMRRIEALAARLVDGTATDNDRQRLAALPAEALRVWGHSAEDLVMTIATVRDRF